MSENNDMKMNNDNDDPPEMVIAVSKQTHTNLVKECKRKGHGFSFDKFGHRRLVKLYEVDGEEILHEVVNGEKARRIIIMTDELLQGSDMLSPFGAGLKALIDAGLTQDEAWELLTSHMEPESESESESDN